MAGLKIGLPRVYRHRSNLLRVSSGAPNGLGSVYALAPREVVMTRFWHVLADAIMRWRVLIWAALAIAAVVSDFRIPRIKFDTQQDTLVPSSSKLYKDNERYQTSFGGSQLEVIFTGDPLQLLSGDNLARLQK